MKNRLYSIISLLLTFSCALTSCVYQLEPEVVVTGVEINMESAVIVEGQTLRLVATVAPANATNKTVTWTSSVPAVATVDNNGLVTAIKPGMTSVIANAGLVNASCEISVVPSKVPVTKVSLDKTEITLFEGEEETIKASIVPDNSTVRTIEWSTSDASVASVSEGKVTAVSRGTATITASADGVYAACQITVEAKPSEELSTGIYLSGEETYRFNPGEHQISIYSAEGCSWYRFLLLSSLEMYQIGPVRDDVSEGDSFDVVLEKYSLGVASAQPVNITVEVVSKADGVMTLSSAAGDMFILRY